MRSYDYLPRSTVFEFIGDMQDRRVSKVARQKGFTRMYLEGGDPRVELASKNQTWHEKRHAFLRRALAQNNPLFDSKRRPTRYHLSLIAWAYSPNKRIRRM